MPGREERGVGRVSEGGAVGYRDWSRFAPSGFGGGHFAKASAGQVSGHKPAGQREGKRGVLRLTGCNPERIQNHQHRE